MSKVRVILAVDPNVTCIIFSVIFIVCSYIFIGLLLIFVYLSVCFIIAFWTVDLVIWLISFTCDCFPHPWSSGLLERGLGRLYKPDLYNRQVWEVGEETVVDSGKGSMDGQEPIHSPCINWIEKEKLQNQQHLPWREPMRQDWDGMLVGPRKQLTGAWKVLA